MKTKRQQIADMWQLLADNPEAYFEYKTHPVRDFIKPSNNDRTPIESDDLEIWRVYIPPKPHPMEKYIELGLDMEFTLNKVTEEKILSVGKLLDIITEAEEGLDYTYKCSTSEHYYTECRLRPNHVHWLEGKSDINPIPEGCVYRVYDNKEWASNSWRHYSEAENLNWNNILAFEIRYL